MTDPRLNHIEIHYLPALNLPPDVFETTEQAAYSIHSDGRQVIGYRIWYGETTILVPKEHVHRIVTNLPRRRE